MYSIVAFHHVFCGTTHPEIDIPHTMGNTFQPCWNTDSASNTKDAKHAAHCSIWSTGARSLHGPSPCYVSASKGETMAWPLQHTQRKAVQQELAPKLGMARNAQCPPSAYPVPAQCPPSARPVPATVPATVPAYFSYTNHAMRVKRNAH